MFHTATVQTPRDPVAWEAAMNAHAVWRMVLDQLYLLAGRATFDAWLAGSRVLKHDLQTNTWTIGVAAAGRLPRSLDVAIRSHIDSISPGLIPACCFYVPLPPAEEEARPQPAADPGRPPEAAGAAAPDPPLPDSVAGRGRADAAPPDSDTDRGRAGTPVPDPVPAAEVASTPAPAPPPERAVASLSPTDVYIKLKAAFGRRALAVLRGPAVSVFFSLALHMGSDRIACLTIDRMMTETGYNSSATICSALDRLCDLGLVERLPGSGFKRPKRYRILGYAWMGGNPAPCLWEEREEDEEEEEEA